MADVSPLFPDQAALELDEILKEAPDRWFRPPEVFEILSNHSKYHVHSKPPAMPPAGSLFLFDRKVLRYFRKDGHNWRKKKDGKTAKEAHEKLKVRGVEALHCYYARGEDNGKFQRRIYWMLDTQFEHIVLVHYREVDEGHKTGMSYLHTSVYPESQLGSPKATSMSWSDQPFSPVLASDTSNINIIENWDECRSKCDDRASEYLIAASDVHPVQSSVTDDTLLPVDKGKGLFEFPKHNLILGSNDGSYIPATSCFWADGDGSSKTVGIIPHQMLPFDQLDTSIFPSRKLIDSILNVDKALGSASSERFEVFSDTQGVDEVVGASNSAPESNALVAGTIIAEAAKLNKLDSFGRWMDREIGDYSLMVTVSSNYWNGLDTEDDDKEVSSLSRHAQWDTDSLGPSLSREQVFSISDIAPAWAYSGDETKVLIVGKFLEDKKASDASNWCCMFGEIEVSCDVLSDNMIRCQVPFHAVGRVPFYLTCGNRIACSEVQEFEFLKKSLCFSPPLDIEEVSVQIRLAKLLCVGLERKWLDCSAVDCDKCKVKTKIRTLIYGFGAKSTCKNLKDLKIEDLLKDKLYEWLASKAHEGDKGPHVLDDEGQGVIHLTASLGYIWAFGATIASGVSPNFRDKQGRTSLHWASYFGREKAVITLIKLGAAASAVDDPTAEFPGGRKAADLASDRGHKGIAGYLAEADLTSHLLSLCINEDVIGSRDANSEAERAVQNATREVAPTNVPVDEDVVLKGSLAAVRKSALAAAMIQAAFRAHSFRLRKCSIDDSDLSLALSSLNKVQKICKFQDYLHSAASLIQHKYRGWKGRKDFLRIRTRIVKLQAHVRGYQVRKQYKKVLWSVSVVEKAILRWRRKKPGLRGFRAEEGSEDAASNIEKKKKDEYEYLKIARKLKVAGIEKALARVRSMVRRPEARNQYMRLVKLGDSKSENE
ncbi:hypothetical protein ACS0TY_027110 [Phlomoides rotata]